MKRYQSLVTDKKKLVRKLEALTGKTAAYTRVPRCAYQIDTYFVEKDGNLTVEHDCEMDQIVAQLQAEGMLGGEMQEEQRPRIHMVKAGSHPAQQTAPVFFVPVTELWEPETSEADTAQTETGSSGVAMEREQEQNVVQEVAWEIHGINISLPRRREQPVETAELQSAEDTEETEEAESQSNTPVLSADSPAAVTEPDVDTGTTQAEYEQGFPQNLVVRFPLDSHNSNSLINLVNTIYSRGRLLSKATGGHFSCEVEFIKELGYESGLHTATQVIAFIRDYEGSHGTCIYGLSFEEDKVLFDGFLNVTDAEHLQSFMVLAEKINKACILQNHVQAKEVDDTNERYALRTWLNRLGMKGMEYKAVRKHLLEHLSGHSAFRTKEEEERAKKKALLKREKV